MLQITDQNFEEQVLKSNLPVMVDFFAAWCGPCQMAAPVLEELAGEYQDKVKIVKLDVDQAGAMAQKYGVMSIPTVVVFKGGQEVKRMAGFPGKEGYKELLEAILNEK
jgi:thioredoxin 1